MYNLLCQYRMTELFANAIKRISAAIDNVMTFNGLHGWLTYLQNILGRYFCLILNLNKIKVVQLSY